MSNNCEPNLGCATTEELLNELLVRAQIGGYAQYRTVDGHDVLEEPVELEGGWPVPQDAVLPPDLSESLE